MTCVLTSKDRNRVRRNARTENRPEETQGTHSSVLRSLLQLVCPAMHDAYISTGVPPFRLFGEHKLRSYRESWV
jgi:hypothetical protein